MFRMKIELKKYTHYHKTLLWLSFKHNFLDFGNLKTYTFALKYCVLLCLTTESVQFQLNRSK